MFSRWLKENKLADIAFEKPLFPKASERDFWEQAVSPAYIQTAETYLGYTWPLIRATQYRAFEKEGDRLAQETPHFARRHSLLCLLLGELAEYEGRFLPDICDGILAICEESYWGVSAHRDFNLPRKCIPDAAEPYIDLFAAETAELLAVAHSILGKELEAFCDGISARILYELERRIVTPYLTHRNYFWMGNDGGKVNNWNPWILSNVLTVFLLTPMDRPRFERGLTYMLQEINHYYSSMPEDGGCDEGAVYWTKAGGKLLAFCDQLYIASNGKVDFFKDEKLHRIGHYEVKAHISGIHFVSFADGSARLTDFIPDYALYVFGARTADASFCALAAELKRSRGSLTFSRGVGIKDLLYSLIYAKAIESCAPASGENVYVLPDLQNAFVHQGDWYYAVKGGHNDESHNHNDVGSCIVYHKGEPVLVDPGCGVYTGRTFHPAHRYQIWTNRSDWHNLPVINGAEQLHGKEYRADHFALQGQTATVSYAKAYPEQAGLLDAVRQIEISDEDVCITDRFSFKAESNTVEAHFITPLKPRVSGMQVILGEKYLLLPSCACTVQWQDFQGDSKLQSAWQTDGLYRICLHCQGTGDLTVKVQLRCL